jgi:YD repeat-containing protein
MVIIIATSCLVACGEGENETKYNNACALIESGDYEAAYTVFKELGDYKDSEKYLSRFVYFPSVVNFDLYDRSGVMTVTLGQYNLPCKSVSEGTVGRKDSEYTYDSKGNLIRQAVTHNGMVAAMDHTYDENNHRIKVEYSENGVVSIVYDYAYDAKGQLIREVYTEEGVVYYDYQHSYDENGNMIKSEYNAPDADYVYTYTYNADGNMINEQCNVSIGHSYNVDYIYSADGKLTRKVRTEDGSPRYTMDYMYDTAGNCIKEERVYVDGATQSLVREYDAHGNVTKEVYTDADGTVETVESRHALTYLTIDVSTAMLEHVLFLLEVMEH